MPSFVERIQNAWDVFTNRAPSKVDTSELGPGSARRPDRTKLLRSNERTIMAPVLNRIAMDVSAVTIKHVRLDGHGRYSETVESSFNDCLNLSANLDQTGRAFIQDVVMSMFDEGCVCVLPTSTTSNPTRPGSYEITSLRTAEIVEWYPSSVKLRAYNEKSGKKEVIIMPKQSVAIIENPLYAVMNEPNSTLRRLVHKLNLLDSVDDQSGSGKLDLIIQLPYAVKNDMRKEQAKARRKEIEDQLVSSKYGIAYTDGTEKITQLNRSIDNNLMQQVEYLTEMFYNQIGISVEVFDGTADEKTMLNYNNRTIEPIVSAIVNEFKRKFLTRTARSQGQSIVFFIDPFKLVPVNQLAEIADKFTRNEIMTSNEIRQVVGMSPADDPMADSLHNSNISSAADQQFVNIDGENVSPNGHGIQLNPPKTGYSEVPPEVYEQLGV